VFAGASGYPAKSGKLEPGGTKYSCVGYDTRKKGSENHSEKAGERYIPRVTHCASRETVPRKRKLLSRAIAHAQTSRGRGGKDRRGSNWCIKGMEKLVKSSVKQRVDGKGRVLEKSGGRTSGKPDRETHNESERISNNGEVDERPEKRSSAA